jgi:hypothetical protein
MVKKLMRPRGSRISTVHPVFPEYESMKYPRLLGSPAAAGTDCLFPDDGVPCGVAYRGLEWRETSGRGGLRLGD